MVFTSEEENQIKNIKQTSARKMYSMICESSGPTGRKNADWIDVERLFYKLLGRQIYQSRSQYRKGGKHDFKRN